MANNVDLNNLRDMIIQNQEEGNERPSKKNKKIFVDREGNIREGKNTDTREAGLSEVPQETFAIWGGQEKKTVKKYFPANTKHITTHEGTEGWLYSFKSEFGDKYVMFAYFDGIYYQVVVVEPIVEKQWASPHTGHVFPDGRICFGDDYDSGMPKLQEAYAKSVLWANGLSVALRTGHFPFSSNQ